MAYAIYTTSGEWAGRARSIAQAARITGLDSHDVAFSIESVGRCDGPDHVVLPAGTRFEPFDPEQHLPYGV